MLDYPNDYNYLNCVKAYNPELLLIKEPISNQSFNCRICLWIFESESELNIHNYLEHMIINHAESRKIIEDTCIAQVQHSNIHLVDSNNLIYSKSISQSRDEIESEVYDKFLSTESLREKDNVPKYVLYITR